MRVGPEGGEADAEVRLGSSTVWVDGAPEGGPEVLAERLLAGDVAVPGAWSAVVGRSGRPLDAVVAPFGGSPLYTDGRQVARDPGELGDLRRRPVDSEGVRQHLVADPSDATSTFALGVRRIPAGHHLVLDGAMRIERAWDPRPVRSVEPVREVRAAVERAVGRTHGPTAVALSGGLDSSIVALLLARTGPVRLISNRFPGWPADEGGPIEAVCAAASSPRTDVDSRSLDPVEVLWLLKPPGFPPIIPNHHLNLALLRACEASLVTGFGGDEVIGHGLDITRELIAAGRPVRALWEAGWLALRHRHGAESYSASRWLRHVHIAFRGPPVDPLARRRRDALHTWVDRSRDEIARVASAVGKQVRTPLLDPRLAEVMLGVPTRLRVRRGRTRWVLREAFVDLLPPEVLRRTDKADLSRSFAEPFVGSLPGLWSSLTTGALRPWLGDAELAACRSAAEAGDPDATAALWRAFGAAWWLSWHTGDHPRRR